MKKMRDRSRAFSELHLEPTAMLSIDDQVGSEIQTTSFGYDGLNRLTQITYPNGMVCTYRYGTDFRLAGITYTMNGQVIDSFAYSYDEVGNISRIDRPNWYVIYGYDLNNQLISADYEGSTDLSDEWYEYDQVGNRTASHLSSFYLYDELDRLLEDEQHWYEWDNNGNLTVKGNKADGSFMNLFYDPENKLRGVEKSDGTVIAYAYDAKGRRVIRSVDGIEERFHYDGDDVLFDTDGSDDITVRYVNLPGSVDQKVYATSLGDGQNYTYLRDHLGTIWKVLDSQGNAVQEYVYDSFGQVKGQTGSLPNRYTYTGREIEPESWLYYYRARYYDPEVGRFVREDPLSKINISSNMYIYAANNIILYKDPFGAFAFAALPAYLSAGALIALFIQARLLLPIVWTLIQNMTDCILDNNFNYGDSRSFYIDTYHMYFTIRKEECFKNDAIGGCRVYISDEGNIISTTY